MRKKLDDPRDLPKICAYCGSATARLTKEHVIPRSFEAPDSPQWQPVIIWACEACNNQKSKLDETLRDLLCIDWTGGNHPTAQKPLTGPIARSVQSTAKKGSAHSLIALMNSMEPVNLVDKQGNYLGTRMGVPLSSNPYVPWLELVVKGLALAVHGVQLPADAILTSRRADPETYEKLTDIMMELQIPLPITLGTHTLFSFRGLDDYPPGYGFWFLSIYGVAFVLTAMPLEPPSQS